MIYNILSIGHAAKINFSVCVLLTEKDACMQMANDCYKKEGMECIAKKDSYTCGCTKGYIKVGDNCARMLNMCSL